MTNRAETTKKREKAKRQAKLKWQKNKKKETTTTQNDKINIFVTLWPISRVWPSHAKWRWTRPKCCACHENCNASSENVVKDCACHTKRLSTRYNTRLNVTKCHACHAKRRNATFETSKNDPFCRTYHRHGHKAIPRTVANGCERKCNVERTHPQSPDPRSETGTLATHSGKHDVRGASATSMHLGAYVWISLASWRMLEASPCIARAVSASRASCKPAASESGCS